MNDFGIENEVECHRIDGKRNLDMPYLTNRVGPETNNHFYFPRIRIRQISSRANVVLLFQRSVPDKLLQPALF